MTIQTPEVIMNQLENNLCSSDETAELRKLAESVKRFIDEKGFGSLADDMNASFKSSAKLGLLEEDDFEGASIYPDDSYAKKHIENHVLPPLSFGVLVSPDKWREFSKKIGIDSNHYGQTLDAAFFSNSAIGLDKSGISFHVDRGKVSDVEFEIISHDINLYSKTIGNAQLISVDKLTVPELTIFTFEYRTFADLCAWRTEPDFKEEDVRDYLFHRLEFYVKLIPQVLELDGAKKIAAEYAYGTILHGLGERIPAVVNAACELESRLGKLTTPVMFSLGSTQEEISRYHLLSPLLGVIQLNNYMASGKITKNQIQEIIGKKGYKAD